MYFPFRTLADIPTLVLDGLCERRSHEGITAHLGSIFLRGICGALPDDTGNDEDEGIWNLKSNLRFLQVLISK